MNFKTKIAHAAVLATLGLVAGSAQAVYMSQDGTGQVLIYPYYTVQNGFDNYLSIVNTTSSAKAVKVRIIEGLASKEVLDFNLYLSAKDVWAAGLKVSTTGSGAGNVYTSDKSCTSPSIPAGGVDFVNYGYTGANADPLGGDLSRTREGYIEIIEMGEILAGSTFATNITHVAGVPKDCGWVNTQWSNAGGNVPAILSDNMRKPTGGLIGSMTLINVPQGVDYTYDPVAMDAFFTLQNLTPPGGLSPSLADVAPKNSLVVQRNGSAEDIFVTDWTAVNGTNPAAPVAAVLAAQHVYNEYALDTLINAGTDWIVTLPTKRFHTAANQYSVQAPFTIAPRDTILDAQTWLAWRACEPISLQPYDREETTAGTVIFSPAPPNGNKLCNEANVITFNNSKVFGSASGLNITPSYQNGWLDLGFTATTQVLTSPTGATMKVSSLGGTPVLGTASYYGLPAVGFAVEKYVNGNVGGVMSNYGGSFVHKYGRLVTFVTPQIN